MTAAAAAVGPAPQMLTAPPDDWDDLAAAAAADIFPTRLFVAALQRHISGSRVAWFTLRDGGRLVGALPALGRVRRGLLSWHSLPDGASGGPLVVRDLPAAQRTRIAEILTDALRARLGGRAVTATLSLGAAQERSFGAILRDRGWAHTSIPASVIPMAAGLEHVEYHVLPKNRRNERNRGLRRGAEIATIYDPAVLVEFYPLYAAAAARWGVAAVPLALMQHLLREGRPRVFLCTVRWEGRLIGAHLDLHHEKRVTAWIGATAPEHNRTLFPATLLIWQGMVECAERGATAFDLGGSAGRRKLSEFKRLFGAEVEERGLYRCDQRWWRWLRGLRRRQPGGGAA